MEQFCNWIEELRIWRLKRFLFYILLITFLIFSVLWAWLLSVIRSKITNFFNFKTMKIFIEVLIKNILIAWPLMNFYVPNFRRVYCFKNVIFWDPIARFAFSCFNLKSCLYVNSWFYKIVLYWYREYKYIDIQEFRMVGWILMKNNPKFI